MQTYFPNCPAILANPTRLGHPQLILHTVAGAMSTQKPPCATVIGRWASRKAKNQIVRPVLLVAAGIAATISREESHKYEVAKTEQAGGIPVILD